MQSIVILNGGTSTGKTTYTLNLCLKLAKERPILYFVPDYEIFKAGVTHSYNILDLPLEEGFGDIAQTADELLEDIRYLAENDFVPKDIYAKRMQNFFGERTRDHAENLYQNLIHRK